MMSLFSCFLKHGQRVSIGYGSTCHLAHRQWHCKIGNYKMSVSRNQETSRTCKMQMVLERTWSKAAPNEMVYLFHLLTSGSWTDKPCLTKRRLSALSVCTCTLESSRVTVWDLNGLMFPICSNTLSPFASHLLHICTLAVVAKNTAELMLHGFPCEMTLQTKAIVVFIFSVLLWVSSRLTHCCVLQICAAERWCFLKL